MNRSTNRLWAAIAGLAACGLILTGCGTGQIAQTANQSSAVNGTSGDIGEISLRNVHLQAVQSSDFLQPGTTVELMFVAPFPSYCSALAVIRGRVEFGTEPQNLLEDGDRLFHELWKRWERYHVANRGLFLIALMPRFWPDLRRHER